MRPPDPPWTDPAPIVVRTTPYLTFPFSHLLLGGAVCGFFMGVPAVRGDSELLSEARGWASLASAAALALAAVALARVLKGQLVIAEDGIAHRRWWRSWRWVPVEQVRAVTLWGDKSRTIDLNGPYGSKVSTTWSVLGWRLRRVRDALRAKGYDVDGP